MTAHCRICGTESRPHFERTVLGRHTVRYYACPQCGFIQTEDPYWLAEAYASPVSQVDTGLVWRSLYLRPRLLALLYLTGSLGDRCVDVGGGYGLLTRLMRDAGIDYYWQDEFSENLLARGFEASSAAGPFAMVSAIEVLEHVADPVSFLKEIDRAYSPQLVFLTTETYSGPPLGPNWHYYEFGTGQHVSFFTTKALDLAAAAVSRTRTGTSWCHVLAKERVSPALVRIALSRAAPALAAVARRKLVPRTAADYEAMKGRGPGPGVG